MYCKTREETETLANKINSWGLFKTYAYHAGLSIKKRDKIQQRFIKGKIKCIVATIAFGMGINIRNVRLVIHYNCPKNLESYYQEIGRAGRDGEPSECHLYYSKKDFIINRIFVEKIENEEHRSYQEKQINIIENYVSSTKCRRISLLKSFDGTYDKETCNNCDNCLKHKKIKQDNTHDYSIVSFIILDLINILRGGYGINTYINILRGSNAKNITPYMKELQYYNVGKRHSVDWFKDIFTALIDGEYLIEKKIKSGIGYVVECSDESKKWIKTIKDNYDDIDTISSDVTIDDKDKIKLKESSLMKSTRTKLSSIFNDDLFTDDVLDRFK